MPRPGPRPYECVRRAWHSDRHQPMRGSLIQEIFRVANEVHSPGTRKNKKWQEKLPIVVLKAEEIMYSKANSETEYMDIKTLWDRANDAIDTIIRRDDTPDESGQDLLHPCIEAALNLGCIPRRASRSQRLSNPGFYLSFNNKEAMAAADNTTEAQLRSSSRQFPSWYPPTCSNSKPALSITHDTSLEQKNTLPLESKDPILEPSNATTEATTLSNLGRVYPLYYYGTSQISPRDMTSKTSSLASPSVPSSTSEFQTCFLLSKLDTMDPSKRTSLISPENPPDSPCDLSLRLGLSTHEVEDIGSNSSSSDLSRFCVF